jgi:hypothetical protein
LSTTPLFDWLCNQVSQRCGLDIVPSRGTLRLTLKAAGLEPRTLNKEQARAVLERLLPRELELRGIPDAASRCAEISVALRTEVRDSMDLESAESIFARLGRRS